MIVQDIFGEYDNVVIISLPSACQPACDAPERMPWYRNSSVRQNLAERVRQVGDLRRSTCEIEYHWMSPTLEEWRDSRDCGETMESTGNFQ